MKKKLREIEQWLVQVYSEAGFDRATIAVSGGIDSAVSLTLLARSLGPAKVFPTLLPYADQDMSDAEAIVKFNKIPEENIKVVNIKAAVDAVAKVVGLNHKPISLEEKKSPSFVSIPSSGDTLHFLDEKLRLGNIMARVRMIILYDFAKKLNALVCGTENKSEKYLGYFTRFGDEASDVEPLQHLYKTQVRALARKLALPDQFLLKAPSAGLWSGQTDEKELGFSYEVADLVLEKLIDEKIPESEIKIDGLATDTVRAVLDRVRLASFKQEVPTTMRK